MSIDYADGVPVMYRAVRLSTTECKGKPEPTMRIILTSGFILAACISSLISAGCDSASQTSTNVLVRTPRTTYHADDTIRVEITNLSGSPIYYLCDGQLRLQLMEGEVTRKSWNVHDVGSCDRGTPIFLGETASFHIKPEVMDSVTVDPDFKSGGEYRLLVGLYRDAECTLLLENESDRLSNSISITR